MTKRKKEVERRKHKRFEVPTGAFVALCPRGIIVGKIVDISAGGLAFGYINGQKPLKSLSELDMFCVDNGFCLRNVRFKTVWDVEIPNELPVNSETMRRSGVRFKRLGRNRKSQLKRFIENHTTGEVLA
jgi:hypothetical protein